MEFVGRNEELKTLRNLYKMNGLKGAIVYGRKGLGKTSLLLESSKDFDGKEKIDRSVVDEEARQLSELNIPYYRLGFFSRSGYNLEKERNNLYFP